MVFSSLCEMLMQQADSSGSITHQGSPDPLFRCRLFASGERLF